MSHRGFGQQSKPVAGHRLSRRTALRASGGLMASGGLVAAGFGAAERVEAQAATPVSAATPVASPAATPGITPSPAINLPLPLMFIAPHRSLVSVYVSTDTIERFTTIQQQTGTLGVTISLMTATWDATQKQFVGQLVLDLTNAHPSLQAVTQMIAGISGVKVLATSGENPSLTAFAQNTWNVAGAPMVVMAQPFIGGTHKQMLESFGDKAVTPLYQSGLDAGHTAASGVPALVASLGLQLTPALIKERLHDIQVFGWGEVTQLNVNDQFVGDVLLNNDFEQAPWQGKATAPVCHFIRGFITGAVSSLTGHAHQVTETKCQAKGDPYCQMTIQLS